MRQLEMSLLKQIWNGSLPFVTKNDKTQPENEEKYKILS